MILGHPGERPFALGLGASLILHAGVMMVWLPAAKQKELASLVPLEVWLRAPASPAAADTPPAPSRELPRPKPKAQEHKAIVPPVREARVELAVPPASAPPQPEAPEPRPQEPQEAPLLPVAKVALPSAATRELLDSYGERLSQVLGRYREYPPIAQMRGWEGSVTIRLRVAPTGRLVAAALQSSSGYQVLDQQALAMARAPERLPPPPEGLRDTEISVLVPVIFKLARE